MRSAPAHAVPAGPLAVRWLGYEVEELQAGAASRARVELENAGSAPWHDLLVSYHWLDDLDNPISWDGLRTPLPRLGPGETTRTALSVICPIPPGRYRLAFDLVLEGRYWLSEIGNELLRVDVDVASRDASRAVAYLTPEVEPAPDWHERVRTAHEEGYAAVGGSIDAGRRRELAAYRPGGGRNPAFAEPLVCPSLLPPLEPNCEVAGLPAWRADDWRVPWIYDARITARLRR
ncbi:MAG TPA: hypothetical protein VFA24_06955 [Gaiellaceae bacterium]|nr:hypothetical protein [Gaiellaceae bacterium]